MGVRWLRPCILLLHFTSGISNKELRVVSDKSQFASMLSTLERRRYARVPGQVLNQSKLLYLVTCSEIRISFTSTS
jgi:hypothetical protein